MRQKRPFFCTFHSFQTSIRYDLGIKKVGQNPTFLLKNDTIFSPKSPQISPPTRAQKRHFLTVIFANISAQVHIQIGASFNAILHRTRYPNFNVLGVLHCLLVARTIACTSPQAAEPQHNHHNEHNLIESPLFWRH